MEFTEEQRSKLDKMQDILQYRFENENYLLSAITHPSAVEGRAVKYSYERLEFLGDSVLGAIVATEAFERFHELDEGGLTRIKVALVAGSTLSDIAADLGFADLIVFGSSEAGTGKRGLHSALENVYEAVCGALFLDGGVQAGHIARRCQKFWFLASHRVPLRTKAGPHLRQGPAWFTGRKGLRLGGRGVGGLQLLDALVIGRLDFCQAAFVRAVVERRLVRGAFNLGVQVHIRAERARKRVARVNVLLLDVGQLLGRFEGLEG